MDSAAEATSVSSTRNSQEQLPKQPLNHDIAEATRARARGAGDGNDAVVEEIFRKDYRPLRYMVHKVHLNFILKPKKTTVITDLFIGVNPNFVLQKQQHPAHKSTQSAASIADDNDEMVLVLDGQETDVALWSIVLIDDDGHEQELKRDVDYTLEPGKLILQPPVIVAATTASQTIRTIVSIVPETNTLLEGLFTTDGLYCTQCEADGFRRITYFPDRPDNLALFERVRIEACAKDNPVLLCNGVPIETGTIPRDDNDNTIASSGRHRHYAVWSDVCPKPSYLFALVAGNLEYIEDNFVTTPSKRRVTLRIYSKAAYINKLQHAMVCLKKAMAWDERTFGLECDSELYQIVAVDDFNAGAMENKCLNIFNAGNILADAKTATDEDFERVERIVRFSCFLFLNWSFFVKTIITGAHTASLPQ